MKTFTLKEITIAVLILFILSFSFYWFSWRPYYAKKYCFKYAEKQIMSGMKQSINELYDFCLLKRGF
jgi:hypothetical protein